ncbi:MAG: HAMP domain-containing sensor histidine kinase [Lachnospiraceae bacterium]|nr:HAMP domain-containing sensor histidine kinase [Lachnospiraceae bacterium]
MQIIATGIIIVLLITAGVLSVRLWCYRTQMRHMLDELYFLENNDTNSLLTSRIAVGSTQAVILAVNHLLTRYRENERRLLRENKIYRESITSISHDIRTPLTSAKGYLQMLQRQNVSEEKKAQFLSTVERRLDHLNNMLNQLFEYARIEAGELALEPEELNVGNLFAETISLFYNDFVQKGFVPEIDIAKKPCKIYADRNALVRIMENLIRNALVHGIGGFWFSVRVTEQQAVIGVSNLTDSIESYELDSIFDRFYTTDHSRSRRTTGLGLAIVKQFAQQMGGSVQATLEEGRFTVQVMLPLLQ